MKVARSVAEILDDHVTLEVEGIDRMYLNVYVPALQRETGVASFFRYHRGLPFASSAVMLPISEAFIASIGAFVKAHHLPLIPFAKGQVASSPASSVYGNRSSSRLPLRYLHSPSRILFDASARSTGYRSNIFRGGHPRESRYRATRSCPACIRTSGESPNTRKIPNPCDH